MVLCNGRVSKSNRFSLQNVIIVSKYTRQALVLQLEQTQQWHLGDAGRAAGFPVGLSFEKGQVKGIFVCHVFMKQSVVCITNTSLCTINLFFARCTVPNLLLWYELWSQQLLWWCTHHSRRIFLSSLIIFFISEDAQCLSDSTWLVCNSLWW